MALIELTPNGLYCEQGDFYIDPWRGVSRALISHAHSDHARPGSKAYLCALPGSRILRERVGGSSPIQGIPYGETVSMNGVQVSFHPAGHILGSAQVRLEYLGETWVFSGDYKTAPDPTCHCFEPVKCHTFITESTFGLPVYRWQPGEVVHEQVNQWWRESQEAGRACLLMGYSLGKAQRLLAALDPGLGPILVHASVQKFLPLYEEQGTCFPAWQPIVEETIRMARGRGIVIAPPAVLNAKWLAGLGPVSTAFASGWMAIRGRRRRQALDRGFVLSDHADWPGLLSAIQATGAENIGITHGSTAVLSRYLEEVLKLRAFELPSYFSAEGEEEVSGGDGSPHASVEAGPGPVPGEENKP